MNAEVERWRRLSALFDEAIDADTDGRERLLRQVQGQDPELARELAKMLAAVDLEGPLDLPADAIIDMDEETAPARLGEWTIGHELGRGGMGVVYAASRDESDTAQRAAIKLLRRRWDGSQQAQRFLHERRILASLTHPNLPRLIDHGLDREGRPVRSVRSSTWRAAATTTMR